MDAFTIVWLLAAALLGGWLVFGKNRRRPADSGFQGVASARKAQKMAAGQGELGLDPQTRFVETPRKKQYRLLNDSEQELYHRLREAMPKMQVFVQVGMAQLALLRGRQEAQRLNQMAGRGVDYVVCDQDFAIIAAIELAWPSSEPIGIAAEAEKHQALQSLGIPLIVFRPNALPSADIISREIADAIVRRNRLEAERR